MKYPVENKEIKNTEDLLLRIQEEEANYNKEKEELLAKGENPVPGLYMEYHQMSVNIIQGMTRYLDKKAVRKLSRYLGEAKELKEQKGVFRYGKDAVLTAIEKNNAPELLALLKSIKTIDINQTIAENAAYELKKEPENDVKEADPEKAKKEKEELIERGNKRRHMNFNHLNKKKALHSANEVNSPDYQQADVKRQKATYQKTQDNIASTMKNDRSGRGHRIYANESVNGRARRNLSSIADAVNKEDIPDVTFTETGYNKVAQDMSFFLVRLNNVKDNKHLYEACGLQMMKQLSGINSSRTFFQKLFHPFKYFDEKDLVSNLKTELLHNGVAEEKIEASRTSDKDYLKEFEEDYLEDSSEDKEKVVIEEKEIEEEDEKEEIKEEVSLVEEKELK